MINKKIILGLFAIIFLGSCASPTAMLGPAYTLTSSGSVIQAGNSVAMSYGFKKAFNQVDTDSMITSLVDGDIRECQTIHSSSLSEIFFDTLDGIDCYRDPFSVFK